MAEMPHATQTSMTILMTPDMANFAGNVHGGSLLKLVDQAAYVCASRYCGQYVVTLSVDQVLFREPIHVGELVTLNATINYVGNTSMEVGIEVIAEDVKSSRVRRTNSCYVTMVALDERGETVKVPPFTPRTPEEKRRYRAAKMRKELRAELLHRHHRIDEEAARESGAE